MQVHHSNSQQKRSRKWWKVGMGAVVVVALGIWVNPIFFLIGPMIFMHLFGHGGGHHSGNRARSNVYEPPDGEQDQDKHSAGCH